MDWSKIAPWNWFKEEPSPIPAPTTVDPFARMRSEMERSFDEALRRFASGTALSPLAADAPLRPSLDISEGRKAYTVRAELPGVEADDVSVEVEGQTLVIRAEKRRESEDEDEGYHCVERSFGALQRVLSLPDDASGDAIEAKFRNGVLELRIPKQPPRASEARKIPVEGG